MGVSREEIRNLAELSRLNLSEDELADLQGDLNDILEMVDRIQELETEDVEPTYHTFPLTNVFGKDQVRPSSSAEALFDHAPESSDGYFVVPRIIEDS